jgi:hypothetical protein
MGTKNYFLLALTLGLCMQSFSQSDDAWPVFLQLPGMEDVQVKQVVFKNVGESQLRMDVYYPPGFDHKNSLPAVVIHNGVSMEMADMAGYRDWGELIAVSGMIGIGHQSRFFQKEDTEDLMAYIRSRADELRIDANRLGIWTASGNGLIGVPLAMDKARTYIRCAAFYYTMLDPEDVEALKPFRQDISLFMVRCGLDEFRANRNIDTFIPLALDADLDLEFINYLEGHHAFDIVDDNNRSREIIQMTLDFFKRHLLETTDSRSDFVFTSKNFYAMLNEGRIDEAKKRFWTKVEAMREDTSNNPFFHREVIDRGLNLTALVLLRASKTDEALGVFRMMLKAYPESPTAHLMAADGFYQAGNKTLAVETAQKTVELLEGASLLNEQQKEAIRKSALEKIEKWRKE